MKSCLRSHTSTKRQRRVCTHAATNYGKQFANASGSVHSGANASGSYLPVVADRSGLVADLGVVPTVKLRLRPMGKLATPPLLD